MLTQADRETIRASLADIRATQGAMLEDIGEIAVMRWLRERGYLVLRDSTDALRFALEARGYRVSRDRLPALYPPLLDEEL